MAISILTFNQLKYSQCYAHDTLTFLVLVVLSGDDSSDSSGCVLIGNGSRRVVVCVV